MIRGDIMNKSAIVIGVVSVVIVVFLIASTVKQSSAEDLKPVKPAKDSEYVGVTACKKCHIKEYTSWKKTKMAKTFNVLKPDMGTETKTKFNLDPKKDYTKDVTCLPCHTTGYGYKGGYKIPKEGDLKSAKIAKENEGTTCEGCHGPGGKYIELHKEVATKKRKYTSKEFQAAGMYKMSEGVCITCHNPDNPTAPEGFKFDYKKTKSTDTHEVFPLKYRTE